MFTLVFSSVFIKVMVNFDKEEIYSSCVLPHTYFHTAQILNEYILKNNNVYWSSNTTTHPQPYHDPIYEMFSPLLYNLKHWVELFCKCILNLWEWVFEPIHDTKELFSKVKILCMDLAEQWSITVNQSNLDEIERLVHTLFTGDVKNTEYRYPNRRSFLVTRRSQEKSSEVQQKDATWMKIDTDNIPLNEFLDYHWKYQIEILSLTDNVICSTEEVGCVIVSLWKFFDSIIMQEHFWEKIRKLTH